MKKVWTEQETEDFKKLYPISTHQELEIMFTKSYSQIKNLAVHLGLQKSEITKMQIAHERRTWTKAQDMFLTENYERYTCRELAQMLNMSQSSVENRRYVLKLKKTENTGRFKTGDAPKNKGKKWSEFMSPEGQKKSSETCFKKGTIPPNHKEIGSIYLRADSYWWIKTGENFWEQLHRVVYRKHHPEWIPEKNDIVEFRDGNRNNLNIENLVLSTKGDSAKRAWFTDKHIVRFITKDPELQKEIIEQNPKIIELKKQIIKANIELKKLQNGIN